MVVVQTGYAGRFDDQVQCGTNFLTKAFYDPHFRRTLFILKRGQPCSESGARRRLLAHSEPSVLGTRSEDYRSTKL